MWAGQGRRVRCPLVWWSAFLQERCRIEFRVSGVDSLEYVTARVDDITGTGLLVFVSDLLTNHGLAESKNFMQKGKLPQRH